MSDQLTVLRQWTRALKHLPAWWSCPHAFARERRQVPEDFFGINIATASDAACDDYVIQCLDELGIRAVRMTLSPELLSSRGFRFLDRLADHNLDIMLCLVPSISDAERLDRDSEAASRWREFLQTVWARCKDEVSTVEIGSTPNRRRWSGFSYESFRRAWEIASGVCVEGAALLAGPNVSDFEPFHNVGFLEMMGTQSADVHTDNLFVERVVEPEAFDHRVAGRLLTRVLNLNLVKKAWILRSLSDHYGCRKTYCTYTCWDAGRVQRLHARTADKKADYLVRYLVITAASGALDRVYWGPLIGYRDCLIDDGTGVYPPDERVSRYEDVAWDPAQYTRESGFMALAHVVRRLKGATCLRGTVGDDGVSEFDFQCAGGEFLKVAWTRDRQVTPIAGRYTQTFRDAALCFDCTGQSFAYSREVLTEQPVFFVVPNEALLLEGRLCAKGGGGLASGSLFAPYVLGKDCVPCTFSGWAGAVMVAHGEALEGARAAVTPEVLESAPDQEVLRDGRNLVFRVSLEHHGACVVKKIRIGGVKRLTYRFRASKARRQWNNAVEMCRRGIVSPEPIAFIESKESPGVSVSYYVCRDAEGARSARDAFRELREGAEVFLGHKKDDVFDALAGFLRKMHRLKIYHRDLSAGNLLIRNGAGGELEFLLVDVGRSRVLRRQLRNCERVSDLVRLCHPLDEEHRELFLSHYTRHTGTRCMGGWQLAFKLYDWKQSLKKVVRGRRGGAGDA